MSIELLQGDCRDVLKTLPDNSVQCVVTSPPYYGLRDYGTAKWEGGDPECEHNPQRPDGGDRSDRTLPLGRGGVYRDVCPKCGAIRIDKQLGLEPTPNEYVDNLVQVFREIRRVLRDDGVCFLNLGDSYAGSNCGSNDYRVDGASISANSAKYQGQKPSLPSGLKPKDLIGIPWMVAFALRDDGWWLRQEICWAKGNPMPESVKDRCTKAHESVFLLTKNARYYFDSDAIKETSTTDGRGGISNKSHSKRCGMGLESSKDYMPSGTRNKRDVWTVNTQSYSGAHYAVMPEKLVEPCILAGSRPGDTVLDPFNGAGTVGLVALKLGRSYIGIELNPEYIAMTERRLEPYLIQDRLCV